METGSSFQLYRQMFAQNKDGLVIVRVRRGEPDGSPIVINMNSAALRICRRSPGEIEGRTVSQLFDEMGAAFSRACSEAAAAGGSTVHGEVAVAGKFYRISLFALFEEYVGIVFSDTTERQRTEQALLSLRRLSSLLQSTMQIETILDDLVREAAAIVGAENGLAALCSPDGVSCYRYLVGGKVVAQNADCRPGVSVPGRVIVRRDPYLTNDAQRDPLVDRDAAARYGVRSAISAPILDLRGRMVGFLEIHNKRESSGFTPFDQDQLASAAQVAALAVRNASAFRKICTMGKKLRDSTERYQHLVEGQDAIVWEADAETFQFTFVSQRAEAILGYPVTQWLEEPGFWANHIHPEDREAAVAFCRRTTAEGKDHRFVYRMLAADGRVVWLRDHARVVCDAEDHVCQLRGLMVDISEAMAVEDSLHKSETLFHATFEGAGIGMALVDKAGQPVQSNPALQSMLGYSDLELAGLTLVALSEPQDAESDRQEFEMLMKGELSRYQAEKRFLRKDGAEIWGRLTLTGIRGDSGIEFAIGMIEDITERKRGEAEIAKLLETVQKDASELEKRVTERTAQLQEINAELDSFAHSVSHDLRAPLRAMQGFVEILLEEGETLPASERVGYLRRILSAAQGMERLIQDLLAYSRLGRQDILLQTVSLDQVVRDASQQLELAGGGKRYLLEVKWGLPEVLGHHAVLVQVVLNLMTNGIKFVPAGTTPRLRVWAEEDAEHCRLFVQDNGIGIAPEHQERIFKIFERLHSIETYPGTGVGLAIVRKAVTRLGGRIGVQSREGEGSRFWIELPKAQPGARPAAGKGEGSD